MFIHNLITTNSTWKYSNVGMCFVQGGWSALMWAAYKGRVEVTRLLLEKGANPNITGQVRRMHSL